MSSKVKWLIFAALSFIIIAEVLYIVFIMKTPKTNNSKSPLSQTRNTITNPQGQTMISFKIQSPLESGKNTYTFSGTFVRIEPENSLIFIKDDKEKVYTFKINNYIYRDTDIWLRVYIVPNIATLAVGVPIDARSTPAPDAKNLLTSVVQMSLTAGGNLKSLGPITVRWNDERDLTKISADYQKNPNTPINTGSPDNIVLAEIK